MPVLDARTTNGQRRQKFSRSSFTPGKKTLLKSNLPRDSQTGKRSAGNWIKNDDFDTNFSDCAGFITTRGDFNATCYHSARAARGLVLTALPIVGVCQPADAPVGGR